MDKITSEMIAPCGMNRALCISFRRAEAKRAKHCGGCNSPSVAAQNKCSISRCAKRKETRSGFCYECPKFPCKRLSQLDERYVKNYQMSMIENLEAVKREGIERFVEGENERRRCKTCGSLSAYTGIAALAAKLNGKI